MISREKLKTKMQKLGLYKPLITTDEGIVIGGNQRLSILKELGVEAAQCTILPDGLSETQLVEIAISDNENDGKWDVNQLAVLVDSVDVDTELFSVNLGDSITLTELPDVTNDSGDKEPDVQFNESTRECPKCGHQSKTGDFKKVS